MYKLITIEDKVRVDPKNFDLDIKDAVKKSLQETAESKLDSDYGFLLAVNDILEIGEGRIYPGDGAIYYNVRYRMLAFMPEVNEIVEGEIVDVASFGAFVRIGPVDAMAHISQAMDDKVMFDKKNSIFVGKKTKKTLKEGDIVRARVVSVSLSKNEKKVALTMRSKWLGNVKYIEQLKKKVKKK